MTPREEQLKYVKWCKDNNKKASNAKTLFTYMEENKKMLVPKELENIKNITPEILELYKQLLELEFQNSIIEGYGVVTMAPYIKKGLENLTKEEQNNVYTLRYKKKLISLEIDYFLDINLEELEKVNEDQEQIVDYLLGTFSKEEQEEISYKTLGVKHTKASLETLVKTVLSDKILSDMIEGLIDKEQEEDIDDDIASILVS